MSNPSKRCMILAFHWVRKKPLTEKPCSTISARPSASAPACNTPHISPYFTRSKTQPAPLRRSSRRKVLRLPNLTDPKFLRSVIGSVGRKRARRRGKQKKTPAGTGKGVQEFDPPFHLATSLS
ncbi:Hypothetical predicted protein [Podarcis lilfordi]|uniref:Uncharacterized protein n=1 Tax=Podarcis lilfordi TaxID=74358 RepID=A0AA35L1F8_9SAUR|nr:Hypothetical predicted protein [Podarcis lilfordi]